VADRSLSGLTFGIRLFRRFRFEETFEFRQRGEVLLTSGRALGSDQGGKIQCAELSLECFNLEGIPRHIIERT